MDLLPDDLVIVILDYLSPVYLNKASLVNKSFTPLNI